MISVARINELSAEEAARQFHHCCSIATWARAMTAARPFKSEGELLQKAEALWHQCRREDWLEAFANHPKIGDLEGLRQKFKDTAHLATGEQAGVGGAEEATLKALAEGNAAYEKRFGFIFIVCATGKSAAEMLALLQARLGNEPDVELKIAAGEQKKITRIRLEKVGA